MMPLALFFVCSGVEAVHDEENRAEDGAGGIKPTHLAVHPTAPGTGANQRLETVWRRLLRRFGGETFPMKWFVVVACLLLCFVVVFLFVVDGVVVVFC